MSLTLFSHLFFRNVHKNIKLQQFAYFHMLYQNTHRADWHFGLLCVVFLYNRCVIKCKILYVAMLKFFVIFVKKDYIAKGTLHSSSNTSCTVTICKQCYMRITWYMIVTHVQHIHCIDIAHLHYDIVTAPQISHSSFA